MVDWIRQQGFVTSSGMEAFLNEQRFITAADMRQSGYATNDDVPQTVIQLFQDESQQFATFRKRHAGFFNSTTAMATSVSD